ncbi:MAG: Jag N-terminal domain-containing protein [Endomicrobia bacterium]|nr:Jag N-terminal domain-containing protein [Endomicrobiia bacterium]
MIKEVSKKYKSIFVEEFEASSVEEAIKLAVNSLKMTKDELEIKVLFEGYRGLFGLKGSKPAKIKVFPNFNKIENVIKFYLIKLLDFVKENILLVDVNIKDETIDVVIIFNNKEILKFVSSQEIYDALCTLFEAFLKKISLLEYKFRITLKSSAV